MKKLKSLVVFCTISGRKSSFTRWYIQPRKETKDEGWIKSRGTNKVDIANTDFEDLPSDWRSENRASAYVAMSLIYEAGMSGEKFVYFY